MNNYDSVDFSVDVDYLMEYFDKEEAVDLVRSILKRGSSLTAEEINKLHYINEDDDDED